ncbi:hypothetical protein Xmau_03090 [Xenorhabdus mauleonii]|uniref:dTDP-4-dehydrorhamnose 3,5-epimerase n=1 Tax=Xenorhabdus mauleonii TaxID=351675 RepID=A0A1I3SHN7_9GAMM|nr:hypothetical protein [Xenorhabdus mauleonii]PHM39183.1 hypothetical protein Xmau_03090 [Xenorhabdus mauleonii]SFJ57950.1 hypothetical protein SAMN05421680_111111 [Xenorhabdus mauleonii]
MTIKHLFEPLSLPDDCQQVLTSIDGLCFVSNYLLESQAPESHPEIKILSNTGSIIGHFVTHGIGFKYSTFEVHVGRLDRLTFHSSTSKNITGYFIDCRRNSPSRGRRLSMEFTTSTWRKLIIPCGVAHTFENIEGVVTRNDLTLFADASNPTWNLLNDVQFFPCTTEGISNAPEFDVNTMEIPLTASTMFYGVQRQLLKGGQPRLSSEIQATIAGKDIRLVLSSSQDSSATAQLPSIENGPIGCYFSLNSFSSIAEASWMIIPTTESCVADWVIIDMEAEESVWFSYHTRQTVFHTFLDREGSAIILEVADLRVGSSTFGRRAVCRFTSNPRFHIRIPSGVAYRYTAAGLHAVRVEYDMFIDSNEPRFDLPPMGADRVNLPAEMLDTADGVNPPNLPLPASVLQMMARYEYETTELNWEKDLQAERVRLRNAILR